MYISSMKLKNYIPLLEFSNIKELVAEYTTPIQLTIGDNGSGKSATLREITPNPANKSNYKKDGICQIVLTQDDDQYVITSYLNSSNSTHSFVKNDVELNISGGVRIQQELIESHLGYTPEIDNLTHMNYNICEMSTSDRKRILLQFNPHDISFILDYYKQICSKIRNIKANIKLMTEKQATLTDLKISTTHFKDLSIRKKSLLEYLKILDKGLIVYNEYIQHFNQELSDENDFNYIETINNTCAKALSLVTNLSKIDYPIEDNEFVGTLKTKIQYGERELVRLTESGQVILNNIKEFEELLKQCDQSSLATIENQIIAIETRIQNNLIDNSLPILSIGDVQYLNELLPTIEQQLSIIMECSKILSIEHYKQLEGKILQLNPKIERYSIDLQNTESDIELLLNKLNQLKILKVPTDCVRVCDLGQSYKKDITEYQTLLEKNLVLKKQLIHKLDKWNKARTKLSVLVSNMNPYINIVSNLTALIIRFPWILESKKSIIQQLQVNPWDILTHIKKVVNNTISKNTIDVLHKDLVEAKLQYEIVKNKQLYSIDKLRTDLEKNNSELKHITLERQSYLKQIEAAKQQLDSITERKRIASGLYKLQNKVSISFRNKLVQAKIQTIQTYINITTDVRNTYAEKLIEIEKILSEQESIHDQLQQLVIPTLKKLEKDLVIHQYIEKALSPIEGIPHRYMVQYLNQLIVITNFFLNRVWSYQMELVPIHPDLNLSFKFKIKIKGHILPDISLCSDGQKDMIDMAFSLAILSHMKILDKYPIFMDENDEHLDLHHRQKVVELISDLINSKQIKQLFIINHHPSFSTGMNNCEIMCLATDNILKPNSYNEHVMLTKVK